jgi:hypothetical protein
MLYLSQMTRDMTRLTDAITVTDDQDMTSLYDTLSVTNDKVCD